MCIKESRDLLSSTIALLGLCFLSLISPVGIAAYEVIEVTNGGAVVGTVRLKGELPQLEPIQVTKNQDFCGQTLPRQEYIIGLDRGVRYVVVSLEGVEKGKALQNGTVVLDNNKCDFVPHVQATTANTIEIKNSDPVLHNTHLYWGNVTLYNIALIKHTQKLRPLERGGQQIIGQIDAKCDAHEWMSGYIWVFSHPYFAVTDEKGAFRIEQIPPGMYTLRAWHEKMGTQEREVTVPAKGEAKMDFEFIVAETAN